MIASDSVFQVAKAQANEEARQAAQDMIDAAQEEREKAVAATAKERQNLEKLLESIKEELAYWQRHAARTEAAHAALQRDVIAMARILPDDLSSMKLAVECKLTRTLIERATDGMEDIVALDDEWLPPLEDVVSGGAFANGGAQKRDKEPVTP